MNKHVSLQIGVTKTAVENKKRGRTKVQTNHFQDVNTPCSSMCGRKLYETWLGRPYQMEAFGYKVCPKCDRILQLRELAAKEKTEIAAKEKVVESSICVVAEPVVRQNGKGHVRETNTAKLNILGVTGADRIIHVSGPNPSNVSLCGLVLKEKWGEEESTNRSDLYKPCKMCWSIRQEMERREKEEKSVEKPIPLSDFYAKDVKCERNEERFSLPYLGMTKKIREKMLKAGMVEIGGWTDDEVAQYVNDRYICLIQYGNSEALYLIPLEQEMKAIILTR